MNIVNLISKIIIGVVVIYLLIGCFIVFSVDPVSRGGIRDIIELIIFWPFIPVLLS